MKTNKNFELMNAVELYFMYLSEDSFVKALESFSEGMGYCVDDYVICGFANEYEVDDEGYFGNSGVKFEIEPPAYDYHKKQVIENTEFISILTEMSEQYKKDHLAESTQIDKLVEEIRSKLID